MSHDALMHCLSCRGNAERVAHAHTHAHAHLHLHLHHGRHLRHLVCQSIGWRQAEHVLLQLLWSDGASVELRGVCRRIGRLGR